MVTWDDAIQDCQDFSGDPTVSALTFFKRQMNKGYKIVLAELNRPTQEITLTTTTSALSNPIAYSDRVYMLPNDALWPRSVKIQVGSQLITLEEEESQDLWDYQTAFNVSGIPNTYFVKPRFGVGGTEILLDPIPAAGYTLEIVYEATDKDLSQLAYTTGTVSVVNPVGNTGAVVTGVGTTFTNGMVGRYLRSTDPVSDGMWYRIIAFVSSTSLILENKYQGAVSLSGVNYTINEIPNIPEDTQQVLAYYGMWMYYVLKKDAEKAQYFEGKFTTDLENSRERWAKKTDSNLIRTKSWSRWRNATPSWFPNSGIS